MHSYPGHHTKEIGQLRTSNVLQFVIFIHILFHPPILSPNAFVVSIRLSVRTYQQTNPNIIQYPSKV
jgi:hypothetical protein